jgi:hypothetical protein
MPDLLTATPDPSLADQAGLLALNALLPANQIYRDHGNLHDAAGTSGSAAVSPSD